VVFRSIMESAALCFSKTAIRHVRHQREASRHSSIALQKLVA
jgi:hypothetical protein